MSTTDNNKQLVTRIFDELAKGNGEPFVEAWSDNDEDDSFTGETEDNYAELYGNLAFTARLTGIPNAVSLNFAIARTGYDDAESTLTVRYPGKQLRFADHRLVADVHPVEIADGERARAAPTGRRLAAAHPFAFEVDERTGDALRFVGEPDRMRFVSDLPPYLGYGGPALHDVTVVTDREGVRLEVSFATVLAGRTWREDPPRPAEPLAADLRSVRLSYRGIDRDGALTGWLTEWPDPSQLPLQVRIEVEGEREGPWPTLVVALVQGQGRLDGSFQELGI